MAAFVQVLGTAAGTSASNVLAATLTASMSAPDSVVVAIQTNGAAISSVTDSKGNTYVIDKAAANGSTVRAAIATCVNPTPLASGDTVTVHLAVATAFVTFVVAEYLQLAAPDQTGSNTGSGTSGSVSTAGATSTATEVAIVSWSTNNTAGSPAATSPFTLRASPGSQGHLQDRDLVATGTITGSFTWTTVRAWVAVIVTYTLVPPAQQANPPFIASATTLYTPQLPIPLGFIASATVLHAPQLNGNVSVPFIASATVVYDPTLSHAASADVDVPFITSATVVYVPSLIGHIDVPFIASKTEVWSILSIFDPNLTFGGPGNGGESWLIRLAPNGTTETATLAADLSATGIDLQVTGDSGFPSTKPFVVTINDEVMLVFQISIGNYRIRLRATSNTATSSHTAGANVVWGDSYDMAIRAGSAIADSFTADINSTGSFDYPGWLICFDSTQAYDDTGARYPMHVTQLLGVFDADAGSSGSNRCDAAQPSAIHTAAATSDDCPAALTNPSLITTDIDVGDVAVLRYTNPEATVLDLGGRSVALQSWFGLKRVSTSNVDVTFTDPNGIVVDTTGTYDTFTGSVNGEWSDPVPLLTGIAPDASDLAGVPIDTPNPVPWTTVTLDHNDRHFTRTSVGDKGWPMCCLAVRQGNRRVPYWQSWDWHDYAYVYDGFGTDCTFCQILINRNGITFSGVPAVDLPGNQDIDGPDAVWDDATYFVGVSWYVVLFNTPYIVFGPGIGGGTLGGGEGSAPGVGFGTGSTPGPPTVSVPPFVEGGSGGNIGQPPVGMHVWQKSGGF